MNPTPQREYWIDEQADLGDAWTLRKGDKVARCVLWSHLFGWKLKLTIADEFIRTQVCRSSEEILNTHEAWKAAMLEKGWT
jgi:hypothetical protein